MRLLVTRPEPDALRLGALLEEAGHEATIEPLLAVSFEGGEPIELDGVQALVATSRNALRALKASPALAQARDLPLFAVGKATAAEARALGFATVVTGAGTAAELASHVVSALDPAAGLVVHLRGDTVAGDLAGALETHGFRLVQLIVYRMVAAAALSDEAREQLGTGEIDGVILLSPRTAAVYAGLIGKHGLSTAVRKLPHFCLSEAVARRLAPLGQVNTQVAETPRLSAVLALIDEADAAAGSG
jgi:uroporphyrinogen-III synthase